MAVMFEVFTNEGFGKNANDKMWDVHKTLRKADTMGQWVEFSPVGWAN